MSDRSGNRRYAAAPQLRSRSHHFDHRIFSDSDAPPGPSHQQPPSESAQAEHAAEDDGSESGAITGCALAFASGLATPRECFTSVADGSWHTVDSSDDGDDSDGGGDHDLAAPGGANVDLIDEFAAADNGDVWDDGGLDFDLGDEFDGETDEEDGAGLAAAGFGCSHYQRNCRWAACSNIARALRLPAPAEWWPRVAGKSTLRSNCALAFPRQHAARYWCRHCHNEAEETVEAMTRVPPTSHTLDRYAVTEARASARLPPPRLFDPQRRWSAPSATRASLCPTCARRAVYSSVRTLLPFNLFACCL